MNEQCSTQYTPAYIQFRLKEAGITQKQIAQDLGVAEISISDVVNFRMVSRRLMNEIAQRINEKPETVFAWYFSQKRPRRPSKAS